MEGHKDFDFSMAEDIDQFPDGFSPHRRYRVRDSMSEVDAEYADTRRMSEDSNNPSFAALYGDSGLHQGFYPKIARPLKNPEGRPNLQSLRVEKKSFLGPIVTSFPVARGLTYDLMEDKTKPVLTNKKPEISTAKLFRMEQGAKQYPQDNGNGPRAMQPLSPCFKLKISGEHAEVEVLVQPPSNHKLARRDKVQQRSYVHTVDGSSKPPPNVILMREPIDPTLIKTNTSHLRVIQTKLPKFEDSIQEHYQHMYDPHTPPRKRRAKPRVGLREGDGDTVGSPQGNQPMHATVSATDVHVWKHLHEAEHRHLLRRSQSIGAAMPKMAKSKPRNRYRDF